MTCRRFCGDERCRGRCQDLSVTDQRSGPVDSHWWPDEPLIRDQASVAGRYWMVRGKLHCRHGVILYGTKCINCERDHA